MNFLSIYPYSVKLNWNFCCAIREQLKSFIQEYFQEFLLGLRRASVYKLINQLITAIK